MNIKQTAIVLGALAITTTTVSPVMARSLNRWPIYWQFSSQEVDSTRREYGDAGVQRELNRRCREGGRSNHLAWWQRPTAQTRGYYFTTNGEHLCRV
jgi:hypothetical protein